MNFSRRGFLHAAIAAASLPLASHVTIAQTYPMRPITMIVAIGAGSSTDVAGRLVAERMGPAFGQPIIVENVARTGAGAGYSDIQ